MQPPPEPRNTGWPLFFFILNACAIVLWFHLSGFFTAQEIRYVAHTPDGPEVNATAIETVDIEFDSPLDPDSIAADSVRTIPPSAGKAELAGDKTLRYRLAEKLRPATTYRLLWSPRLKGKSGRTPPQELCEFSTTRFAFTGWRQTSFDNTSYTVELSFNQPIRSEVLVTALEKRFSLDPPYGGLEDRISVVTSGSAASHRVRIRETRASFVELRLPAGLCGGEGALGLAEDVKIAFRLAGEDSAQAAPVPPWAENATIAELKPTLEFLGMTGSWEDGTGVVIVRTTSPIDLSSAKNHVRIEPEVPVSLSSSWRGLKIAGDFKPGKQYRVTLLPGLSAGEAKELGTSISRNVWFDDLPPSLEFTYGGGYLLPGGMLKIPVTSVNVGAFRLRLRKLYPENIVEASLWHHDDVGREYAAPDREETIVVRGAKNEKTETLLDLRSLAGDDTPGVYGIEIWTEENYWRRRSTIAAVSGTGVGAFLGKGRLLAWTVSLASGLPRAGCEVSVYSNRRRLLAEGVSGEDGCVSLDLPDLPGDEKPTLVLALSEEGTTFVHLDNGLIPNAGGTRGDAYAGRYEAFVTPERGVYRGGETARVSGLVRNADLSPAEPMPVDIVVVADNGTTVAKTRGMTDAHGRVSVDLRLPREARGGRHVLQLRLPGQERGLVDAALTVADYIPETLAVNMTLPEEVPTDRPVRLDLAVRRLAGGETGKLAGKALINFSPASFFHADWKDWRFGDARVPRNGSKYLERHLATSADGEASAEWTVPAMETAAAVLMEVRGEIMEPGGRTAWARLERTIHTVPFYVGALAAKNRFVSGEEAGFELAAVAPDGSVFAPESGWKGTLYRIEYNGLLKRRNDGRLVYDWQRREIFEADLSGDWEDGRAMATTSPLMAGSYRLVVETDGGRAATLDFSVGGRGAAWSGENPEALALSMDEKSYPVGATARVAVLAAFAGNALVSVETDKVVWHRVLEMREGENIVEIPVEESMRPNAFVHATLVRPVRAESVWRPHRASGTALLAVDNRDRLLRTRIDAPESVKPGGDLDVAVHVTGPDGTPASGAPVVVWGVDVGILSLTGYDTPSPWERIHRRRGLGVAAADMYSRLAPELEAWRLGRDAAPGGGGDMDQAARRFNPVAADRIRPVVLYRGDLVTGEDGVARASFPVPEAAVRLRLMAWTAADRGLGSADREVEIRAPISLQTSWPRFAAPGDEFIVHATLLNRSGADGVATLTATVESGLELVAETESVDLADGGLRTVRLRARALETGVARATVTATMGADSFSDAIELAIRPPVLFERQSGAVEVRPGTPFRITPGGGMMRKNGMATVVAGGSPQIRLSGSLEYLLAYPYGCAEQTASRLTALTALPDLLALHRPGQVGEEETKRMYDGFLSHLAGLQRGNGGFAMWPHGEDRFWVSAHILSILEECRSLGRDVPETLLTSGRRYLRDRIEEQVDRLRPARSKTGTADGGSDVALACLALARGDALRRSVLTSLEEIAVARAATGIPLDAAALAYLCEATLLAGDPDGAAAMWDERGPSGTRQGLRADETLAVAAWLSAGLRLGLDRDALVIPATALDAEISRSPDRWSTREHAAALTVLGRFWTGVRLSPDAMATATVDGAQQRFAVVEGRRWERLSPGTEVAVSTEDGPLHLSWTAEGIPVSGRAAEVDAGLTAPRRVHTADGVELTAPFRLEQGEVYRITLEIRGDADDLAVADLLPAGLEIENPELGGRSDNGDNRRRFRTDHVERKDDRLLVFGSVRGEGVYQYLCRAVTPGDYIWPALDAGRMYAPMTRSVHGETRVTVEALAEEKE